METTVITYGGLDILYHIFNSVAMLFNGGTGGIVKPLCTLAASIGCFWALTKAFFSPSVDAFVLKFFLPVIVSVSFFLIPTTTLKIEDKFKLESKTVAHVPLLLGKFAETISTVSDKITTAFESVMHTPNDKNYLQTGMIFGAETDLDISRYQLTNADLEQNLGRFAKQCVLYDIALGKYTIDQMKTSNDLWDFFAKNTSNTRMMRYTPPANGPKTQTSKEVGPYVTCKKAIELLTPYFEAEKCHYLPKSEGNGLVKREVLKNLPLTFQALTGLQAEGQTLIGQQLMMNTLTREFAGSQFAKSRAQTQQRNTYNVIGSMAGNCLITSRIILEGLVYASFVLIIPLSLLPGGFRFIGSWSWIALWIQLWPPFYVILNYMMQIVARSKVEAIFGDSLNGGLNFVTSAGLQTLSEDIFALCGFMSLSIPYITYAILQGGVNSFIHLAGSMMSPAHSAAQTAASDLSTGNYSFGNTNFGGLSFQNRSALQANYAPSLSSGFFQESSGAHQATYGIENILKQSSSDLRTSISSDDSISCGFQRNIQQAQSAVDTAQESYSESVSKHSRYGADLTEHLANSKNYSEGVSEREAYDIQKSARFLESAAENWGRQHGLSKRESLEVMFGVHAGANTGPIGKLLGVDIGIDAKMSGGHGHSRDDYVSSAMNVAKSEEFQKSLQAVQDYSKNKASGSFQDEGVRIAQNYNRSVDEVVSSQESFQSAKSYMEQVSDNSSWATQNSHVVRKALNQDFVNWASETKGGFNEAIEVLEGKNTALQDAWVQEYVGVLRGTMDNNFESKYSDTQTSIQKNSTVQKLDVNTLEDSVSEDYFEMGQFNGLHKGSFSGQSKDMERRFENTDSFTRQDMKETRDSIAKYEGSTRAKFKKEREAWDIRRVLEGPSDGARMMNMHRIKDVPFWVNIEGE